MKKEEKVALGALGVGAIALGISQLRKPPQEGTQKCVGYDLYEYRGGGWVLVEASSPACGWKPPGEETGIIQGYVVDAETGEHIPNASIYLDGKFALYSWADDVGGYRIGDILYGTHTITVEADDYQTTDFEIVVDQPIQSINLEMPPLPPGPPGEWSEGVEVQKIFAEPETAYLGEIVNLKVYIQYGTHDPGAYPTPANISGTVKIDGQEIKKDFNITFRNPTLIFEYTATQVGGFQAIAQGKSCGFMVIEKKVGVYSPFGGERMPVCQSIIVPDLPPFYHIDPRTPVGGTIYHPGGDLELSSRWQWDPILGQWNKVGTGFFKFPQVVSITGYTPDDSEFQKCMDNAYPSEWDIEPMSYKLYRYKLHEDTNYPSLQRFLLFPVEYSCPPYWSNNDELGKMIAAAFNPDKSQVKWPLPDEFIDEYGTNYYISSGLKDWVKPISIGLVSHSHCWIICPYCGVKVIWSYPWPHSSCDAGELAKNLLAHIDNDHPDHPLTELAWF